LHARRSKDSFIHSRKNQVSVLLERIKATCVNTYSRNNGNRYVNGLILVLDNCTKGKCSEEKSQSMVRIKNQSFVDEVMLDVILEDRVGSIWTVTDVGGEGCKDVAS
jgi:hypothetical protein